MYKKVQLESLINKNTMKEEIDPDMEWIGWMITVEMKIHTEN